MNGIISKLFGKKKHSGSEKRCAAVVPAAGSSRRMGGVNKLLLPLDGMPVLARTLLALDGADQVWEIVIAAREEDLLSISDLCKTYGIRKPVKIVVGGDSRVASVLAAAMECREDMGFIAVHDGARPLVRTNMINEVIKLAYRTNAAAPAVAVKDTIKVVSEDGTKVESTPDRRTLRAIQTPQVFDAQLLKAALQSAIADQAEVTDDCSAVERLGKEVYLMEGDYENIKITTPEDISLAAAILEKREGL